MKKYILKEKFSDEKLRSWGFDVGDYLSKDNQRKKVALYKNVLDRNLDIIIKLEDKEDPFIHFRYPSVDENLLEREIAWMLPFVTVIDDEKKDVVDIQEEFAALLERIQKGIDVNQISVDQWKILAHGNARSHGFWEDPIPSFGDTMQNINCEIAEAFESYRKGEQDSFIDEKGKPQGKDYELVDALFRILDYLGYKGVNIAPLMAKKFLYNLGRPYKHGKLL